MRYARERARTTRRWAGRRRPALPHGGARRAWSDLLILEPGASRAHAASR